MSLAITTFLRAQAPAMGLSPISSSFSTATAAAAATPAPVVRLLDYACGTGLASHALAPFITAVTGVDLAPNMVARYNELAAAAAAASASAPATALPPMHAVAADLVAAGPAAAPLPAELASAPAFDTAIVALGFHHFHEPARALARLAAWVRPGGLLAVVDFVEEEGARLPGAAEHTVRRHGFGEGEMRALFEREAGCGRVGWEVMDGRVEMWKGERCVRRKVFVAWGRRKRSEE